MIGVFDSGLGGLTVFKELIKKLPEYNYVYLGDSARAPYGNKAQAVIYDYTAQAVDFLFKRGCGLIIIACNTASAKALRRLQQEWLPVRYPERRILGVAIPAAEAAAGTLGAVKPGQTARIGVIGTRATIGSGVYEAEIRKALPAVRPESLKRLEIFTRACPLLVPLVEEGWAGKPEAKMILKKYLRPLKEKKIRTLILGCTHYPYLQADIARIMGKNVKIVSTPEAVADKLKDYLLRHPEIESRLEKNFCRTFYTTDEVARFRPAANGYLGATGGEFTRIKLE